MLGRTIAWAVTLALVGTGAAASDSRLLAVEGHVEMDDRTTALALEVPWQDYGVSFDVFAAAADDPVERAFAAMIAAFRDRDAEALDRVLLAPGPRDQIIDFWNKAFNRFEGLTVIGRSTIGTVDTIFWEIPAETGPFLRAFAFSDTGEGWKGDLVGSNRAVLTLLMHSLEHGGEAAAGAWRLPLRVKDSGAAVPLTFYGEAVAFDVWDGDLAAADEALSFYAESWRMLRAGGDEAFIARHTGGSAEKMAEQLQPGRADAFRQRRTQPRIVWLVMDADPLVYVFFTEGQGAAEPGAPIRHDTMVRTEDGLRLTNVYYGSHVDQVFETAIPETRGAFMEALKRRD